MSLITGKGAGRSERRIASLVVESDRDGWLESMVVKGYCRWNFRSLKLICGRDNTVRL
jgi:hypothetical protein